MFFTYKEFKDALVNFHPEKIGYFYCKLSNGWVDDENTPNYKFTEIESTWILWSVKEKSESEVGRANQNDPLQTRNLLCKIEIIAFEDYWQELHNDSDSF